MPLRPHTHAHTHTQTLKCPQITCNWDASHNRLSSIPYSSERPEHVCWVSTDRRVQTKGQVKADRAETRAVGFGRDALTPLHTSLWPYVQPEKRPWEVHVLVKQSRTLWSPSKSSLPAFCLWKNFSQRISLMREVRKCRSKEKQSYRTKVYYEIIIG